MTEIPCRAAMDGTSEIPLLCYHHSMISWEKYLAKRSERPPRELVASAVREVAEKGQALDLGAGAMVDTQYLLDSGFEAVLAVDLDAAAAGYAAAIIDERFTFQNRNFTEIDLPAQSFDLVTAQYSLPFLSPEEFASFMPRLLTALRNEGIFTGQLSGVHDGWNVPGAQKNFHTKDDVLALFSDFEFTVFDEVEEDKPTALGQDKHWHTFNIIARKLR